MSFSNCRIFGLLLLGVAPAYSQVFSFGVKAGVPFSDAYKAGTVPSEIASVYKDHYIVGPTAEVRILPRLVLEVDALYRRNGFSGQVTLPSVLNFSSTLNDWQFPVLAKYETHAGPLVHPFLDAGFVYRHVSIGSNSGNANSPGFAVGGGVSLKLLSLRLSPEIRYTHWDMSPVSTAYIGSTRNQVDLLVGFTF